VLTQNYATRRALDWNCGDVVGKVLSRVRNFFIRAACVKARHMRPAIVLDTVRELPKH
jgi:hypothetical protein